MKKLMMICFLLGTSVSMAASLTDLNTKWVCTTNASSSDVAAEKAADDNMANTKGSVAHSFEFAAKNCRDCTKITCEVKD